MRQYFATQLQAVSLLATTVVERVKCILFKLHFTAQFLLHNR